MPSLTSIITTAILTTSALLPTVSAQFPAPIEGLPQCDQTIVFDMLADAPCNPANFPCICETLALLQVRAAIADTCTESDTAAYDAFVNNFCFNNRQVTVTSTVAPTIPLSTAPPSNVTSTAGPFPVSNSTVPLSTGAPVQPTSITTEIVIPTTDAAGNPTTVTQQTVLPPSSTSSPEQPEFPGAAVAFGSVRYGILAGGIGLMGLIFAKF